MKGPLGLILDCDIKVAGFIRYPASSIVIIVYLHVQTGCNARICRTWLFKQWKNEGIRHCDRVDQGRFRCIFRCKP